MGKLTKFITEHILGIIVFTVITSLACSFLYDWLRSQPSPIRGEDFRFRFAVVGAGEALTEKDINRAPTVVHCNGKIGPSPVEFDLRLVPTIAFPTGYDRGPRRAHLWYESEHFILHLPELLNKEGTSNQHLRFTLPMSLRGFAGPSTEFKAEFYFRSDKNASGYQKFEGGTVEIQIRPSA